jgi:hypothetical protein
VTNKRANESYVLYQCGTPDPSKEKPGTVVGLPAGQYKTFQIPLVASIVDDTTVGGFLVSLASFSGPSSAESWWWLMAMT